MFVPAEDYSDIQAVESEFPGATAVEPVDGGWMVFYNAVDYETWQGQE